MKKAASLLLVLAMFMSASCGMMEEDKEEVNTSLVGSWGGDEGKSLIFDESGEYSMGGTCPEQGTWSDNGSTFTITTMYVGGDTEYCGTASNEPDTMSYSMAEDGDSFTIYGVGESGNETYVFYRQY